MEEGKEDDLSCKICAISLSDPAAKVAHLEGKRHKKAAEKAASEKTTSPKSPRERNLSEEEKVKTKIELETEEKERKLAKAENKRKKKQEKEKESKSKIEEDVAKGINGPSLRDVELRKIEETLKKTGLEVKTMLSDGHCLYRAIADQLEFIGQPIESKPAFSFLRIMAAKQMLEKKEEYLPYLYEIEGEGKYIEYCNKVRDTAEWGGQIELRALVSVLRLPITVWSADSPPIIMGEEFTGPMLNITYHLHYYALGEHYNSTTPY